LAGVVTTAFIGLGYYIGSKDKISEQNVVLPQEKAMPWQQEGNEEGDLFKYKVIFLETKFTLMAVPSKRKSKKCS